MMGIAIGVVECKAGFYQYLAVFFQEIDEDEFAMQSHTQTM